MFSYGIEAYTDRDLHRGRASYLAEASTRAALQRALRDLACEPEDVGQEGELEPGGGPYRLVRFAPTA